MLKHLVLVILAVAALFAVACDDSPEDGMAIFGVSDINAGDPITGATAASVPMTFRWRPYFDTEGSITEAFPHGDFVIEHYRVTFTAASSGVTPPGPREEATSIFVPVYELVTANIIVMTAAEAGTIGAGSVVNANIEFTAREMGTDQDAKFATTVSIHF
jgi:hypothetical protein